MPDDTYVLDLQVTGAEMVTVNDDGAGVDAIVVQGMYEKPVEISLCWTAMAGQTVTAGALYYGAGNLGHRLVVRGLIENASGSNGADFIQGNELANVLLGDNAATGPGGADTLWGGAGNDLILGGAGADLIAGDADDDHLSGGAADDTLNGGSGADTVEGGPGSDVLSGGGGPDDTVSYLTSTDGVRVGVSLDQATTGHGGDAQGDLLDGFLNVLGSNQADRITDTGTSGADDNQFFGNGGRDRLTLGLGQDLADGGKGNDLILGEAGDDVLLGGTGRDRLIGGPGQDTLTGGTDADRFIFKSQTDSSADVITDFATGDMLDLRDIDADSQTRGNQTFHLASGFSGAAGEVVLTLQGADLVLQADVNGDALADFSLILTNLAVLPPEAMIL